MSKENARGMQDDLISRQMAIDALAEHMPQPYTPDGSHPADEGIYMAQEIYADCIQTLEGLPPTRPEIIHCEKCRYSEYDAIYGDRYCHYDGNAYIVPNGHYCGYGENR